MDSEEIRAASRRKRAERKLAQQRAVAGGVWTRCLYKVPGKERSKLSAKYCGTHMGETEEKGRRVPCPVDPNHTVFENQLAAHVKVCNLTILQARMEAQPYFSKGINSGPPLPKEEVEEEGAGDASDAAFNEAFLLDLISRVAAAHRELVGEIPTEVLDHMPEVQPLHRTLTEDRKGFRKGRHVLQHASLVGHLVKRGLVGPVDKDNSSRGTVTNHPRVLHVEMGAGKGALGQSIATAFPGAEVTLVERSSVRRKAENRLDGVSARARIDIRDLNMAGLPSLAPCGEEGHDGGSSRGGKPVVAVAKHLCGVATDLALRAMLTLYPRGPPRASREGGTSEVDGGTGDGGGGDETVAAPSIPSAAATAATAASRVEGVAIATCCHHVCNWRDYAGRDFLSRQGFTARDFEAMRRISAWISLEPDAGARKNNKYPDDKHPAATAAAAAATADSTPVSPLPPPSRRKVPAATAPPATIAEEHPLEVTESSGRGATSTPAASASTAMGAARPPSPGGASASPSPLPPPPTALSPSPRSPTTVTPPQAGLPATPIPDTAISRGLDDRPAVNAADNSDDDDDDDDDHNNHHRHDHAPPPIQSAPATVTAATTLTPAPSTAARGVAAAVVATRLPKPLLALPGLTPVEKVTAARECKRLIDRGRRAFIEERLGLASEVVHFVGREVTPENALLLGFVDRVT
eukprot:g20469.t1